MAKSKKIYYVFVPSIGVYFIAYNQNKLHKILQELKSERLTYYVKEVLSFKN
jgi:hypothetical protein